nr:DUF899 family protein [Salipaludibacillus neizhouensis]
MFKKRAYDRIRSASVLRIKARGTDLLIGTFNYLDLTALGRQ